MGMAASQARFLGLTARKSNVEYQGQQINQQRTALSNESANLYNQMLELTVPTPPSTNNFYKTTYVLNDTQEDYSTGDYYISNAVKTYGAENQYEVTLTHDVETRKGQTAKFKAQPKTTDTEKNTYLRFSNNGYITKVKYDENSVNPYKEKSYTLNNNLTKNKLYTLSKDEIANDKVAKPDGYSAWYEGLTDDEKAEVTAGGCYFYKDNNGDYQFRTISDETPLPEGVTGDNPTGAYTAAYTFNIADEQFYQLTAEEIASDAYPKPTGFDEWLESLEDKGQSIKENGCYFYKDSKGEYHFVTNGDLDALNTYEEGNPEKIVYLGSSYTYTTPYSTKVIAQIEANSSGRYSSITISDDPNYPAILQNKTISITTKQEYDENGYNDAYNDYEYEKYKYEQAIQNINAKTEIIQSEDQQLELRLQQLNTEQDAIKTEMDSVSKVIQDNVEKTFKTFA